MNTNGDIHDQSSDTPVFNTEYFDKLFGQGEGYTKRMSESMAWNVLTKRQEWFNQFMDPRRDVYAECGYPKTLTPENFRALYDREAIAARVVEVYPLETWQVQPEVYDSDNEEEITEFEEAWDNISKQLRGEHSFYKDEKRAGIYEYMLRADIQCGIGKYGVILIGVNDGLPLSAPVAGVDEKFSMGAETVEQFTANAQLPILPGVYNLAVDESITQAKDATGKQQRKLLYLRVFPEDQAPISRFESNPTSPRFGQPIMYRITINDDKNTSSIGAPQGTWDVHWTRVIHIADNKQSSEVFGTERMKPVVNNLLGLQKLYCGSPEMYWKGAFYGISFETHPQLGGQVKINREQIKDNLEQYMNGLERYLLSTGMAAKTLAPTVVDPTPQIKIQLEAIAIKMACPMRVFMGSERGELASSADDDDWNGRLDGRADHFCTPSIVVPVVDRFIMIGFLPMPKEEGYSCAWPPRGKRSEADKAQVAVTKTQALSTYVQSGSMTLITPIDFLTKWLGFEQDEANQMLENSRKAMEDEGGEPTSVASPLLQLVGGITGMVELFQKFKDGAIGEETLKQLIMLFYGIDEEKAEEVIADGLPESPNPALPPIPPGLKAPGAPPFGKPAAPPFGKPVAAVPANGQSNEEPSKKPNPFAK